MKRLSMPIDRRALLASAAALAACSAAPAASTAKSTPDAFAASPWRKLTLADWKQRLPGPSFDVLRQEGTEQAFTSPLNNEHRHGTFVCLGCGLALFKSEWKFDSGTGWPSFYTETPGALSKKADFQIVEERTEYHCAQCLGHQGHVFNDGPQPTGLRYCNNGVALKFIPS
jgi:peptide-methionine (R)-S-oxide reductase